MLQDVLDCPGPGGDAVALIEAELVTEGVLPKPDASEGVQQTFVQVIGHSATILDLTWAWTLRNGVMRKLFKNDLIN